MKDEEELIQEPDESENQENLLESTAAVATDSSRTRYVKGAALFLCAAVPPSLIVFLVGLLQYYAWFATNERQVEKDVVCTSAGCKRLERFLETSINTSADACNDFYAYVCSNQNYTSTFKTMRQQQRASLTRTLRASPVPAQRQTALQKMTALFCSCVSLVSENRTEGAELWSFLDQHGLLPLRRVRGAAGMQDPLDSVVRLSVTYGLQPLVAFASHGSPGQSRYHHLDFSSCFQTWQLRRRKLADSSDLPGFVLGRISLLAPPLDDTAVLALSEDIISTENEVAVMLVQLNRSLEATNRTFPFWIKIKDLGAYSVDAISSQRWLHVIRGRTNPSSDDDDDMYARPLALSLLSRLMTGDPSTARTLLWWGVVRELAPYASGRFLPTDTRHLNNFCVQRVAAEAELAIMAVHLFRAVSPSTTSAARAMAQRIQSALVSTLRSAPWLRGRTRAVAVRKASAMRLAVGFPPSLENEAKLDAYFAALADLRPDRSLASWLALRRFLQRKGGLNYDLAMTHAHKVNAYYAPGNTVVLPAGIIQEPVYFDDAAHAYNYGSLGQALGHEMTHAYDKNGRDWDDRGKRWNWWSRSSMASYEDRLKCIRTSHVEVERALRHWEDGAKQDPENLADFGGAYVAYRAFRDLSPDQRCFSVAGFSSEQLFFIGHCVKWCRPLNVHRNQNYARGLLRCIVPLMHMPQFSDAFGCRRHDHMNPARKCSFWL